jgi:glycosyltransferase involved in cell wall biosynthesis
MYMKWLTCTPYPFIGNESFYSRDSGLFCRGFQEIGIDCQAVMPEPARPDDLTELIRTPYKNLERPDWWAAQKAQGVVFYGWGVGKYAAIARAIRRGGLILVSHLDSSGLVSPLIGVDFYKAYWYINQQKHQNKIIGSVDFLIRNAYHSSIGILKNDLGRIRHLKQAHLIGAVSPVALNRYQKLFNRLGQTALSHKTVLIPHPIPSYMQYDPRIKKEPLLVAVGRWDDEVIKGTALLIETVAKLLSIHNTVTVEIYGSTSPKLNEWYRQLSSSFRKRVQLKGKVKNQELVAAYNRAQVSLCTSLSESFHIASGEALCCGCSVVGSDMPQLPSFKWFTDGPFGRLAKRNSEDLAKAVFEELQAWESGERDPLVLSRHWSKLLHAPNIARKVLELAENYAHEKMLTMSGSPSDE